MTNVARRGWKQKNVSISPKHVTLTRRRQHKLASSTVAATVEIPRAPPMIRRYVHNLSRIRTLPAFSRTHSLTNALDTPGSENAGGGGGSGGGGGGGGTAREPPARASEQRPPPPRNSTRQLMPHHP